MHHTLCTIHCAPYTVHHTLCTIHCAPYTVHHTLCTIHCAPYTVHHTLCTIHCALIPNTFATTNLAAWLFPHTGGPRRGVGWVGCTRELPSTVHCLHVTLCNTLWPTRIKGGRMPAKKPLHSVAIAAVGML